MPLETATYIPDLVTSNPAHTDGLSQADSHIRLLKSTIKTTFPNFTDVALASTQAQLDAAVAMTTGAAVMPFNAGTAALPGLYPLGSPSTGLWSPAANQLALSLNGVQVLLMGGTALVTTLGVAAAAFTTTGAYSGGTGQLVPIGSTLIWWDDVLPVEGGYVWANGQPISRTTYPILFARWGTRFGAGDGSTTFGIPDLRDTVPVGKSTMGGVVSRALQTLTNTVLGALFGEANHTLVAAEHAPHQHSVYLKEIAHSHPNSTVGGTGTQAGTSGGGQVNYNPTGTALTGMTIGSVSGTANDNLTASQGSGTAHNNVQPSTTANYILRAA